MDTIPYQLKTMSRQYGLYAKNKIALKNNLIALLDQTYPGLNALFDSSVRTDGSQKWEDFAALDMLAGKKVDLPWKKHGNNLL